MHVDGLDTQEFNKFKRPALLWLPTSCSHAQQVLGNDVTLTATGQQNIIRVLISYRLKTVPLFRRPQL